MGCPPVDWRTVTQAEFVSEPGCWNTCGGGFCCANRHPDFQFQLMPTEGTTLLYMEDEYRYLARHGKVSATQPQTIELDYGGPQPLRVVHAPCKLLGACQGVLDKPLLCKLYPFLPLLAAEGGLVELLPLSIFDLTFSLLGAGAPCTVLAKRERYRAMWTSNAAALDPLRHPYILLYLWAAKHFSDSYSRRLQQSEKLRGKQGPQFWKRWEMEYLSGRLVDAADLKRDLLATYQTLERRYGTFLTPQVVS